MTKDTKSIFKGRGIPWVAVILLMVAAFTAGVLWRGRGAVLDRHDTTETGQPDAPAAKAQMYYCSMHPQVRSPDPDDKCPICFMDLIPLPDDDDDGDDETDVPRLRLSARAAALMDIRTWPVERRAVELEINLFGKIGYDESRLYDIVARTDAYVERLAVNTPWRPVAKGEVLAEFYSPTVVTAFRELLVAAERPGKEGPGAGGARDDGRNVMQEAARARLMRWGVSAAQIDEALESGEAPRTFQVESPAAGVALPMVVREGEWLREGGRLTRIADLSRVWVNLEAYERDLAWLATGQKVRFNVTAYPGEAFEGKIVFIDPVINERSRTARLRVEVDNPDGRLKPEMLVSATGHATLGNATLPPSLVELRRTGQRGPDEEARLEPGAPTGNATLQRGSGKKEAGLEPGAPTTGNATLQRGSDEEAWLEPGAPTGNATLQRGSGKKEAGLEPGAPTTGNAALHGHMNGNAEHQPASLPLVIPASAPLITGRRALVYVRLREEDRPTFEPRQVTLGPRAGDYYIVREGLEEGDLVVVNGQFKIDSELQIRGRPSMMAAEGGRPPVHDHGPVDHAGHDEVAEAPRLQTQCPVMGGPINTDFYADVEGYRIFVCCPGCDKTILDDPKSYLEKMKAEGITPYRLQTHCPIMGGAINRDFYHDHDGQRIYVCCPPCLDEVRERADAIIEEQFQQGIVFERAK